MSSTMLELIWDEVKGAFPRGASAFPEEWNRALLVSWSEQGVPGKTEVVLTVGEYLLAEMAANIEGRADIARRIADVIRSRLEARPLRVSGWEAFLVHVDDGDVVEPVRRRSAVDASPAVRATTRLPQAT
jgi:hypothetical protein